MFDVDQYRHKSFGCGSEIAASHSDSATDRRRSEVHFESNKVHFESNKMTNSRVVHQRRFELVWNER